MTTKACDAMLVSRIDLLDRLYTGVHAPDHLHEFPGSTSPLRESSQEVALLHEYLWTSVGDAGGGLILHLPHILTCRPAHSPTLQQRRRPTPKSRHVDGDLLENTVSDSCRF